MNEVALKIFREGLAPILSLEGLLALERAMETDDPRLLQGGTTEPPPFSFCADWKPARACLIALPYWLGDGLETLGEIEEAFARTCHEIHLRTGIINAAGELLTPYDTMPREEMIATFLPEVKAAIASRRAVEVEEDKLVPMAWEE